MPPQKRTTFIIVINPWCVSHENTHPARKRRMAGCHYIMIKTFRLANTRITVSPVRLHRSTEWKARAHELSESLDFSSAHCGQRSDDSDHRQPAVAKKRSACLGISASPLRHSYDRRCPTRRIRSGVLVDITKDVEGALARTPRCPHLPVQNFTESRADRRRAPDNLSTTSCTCLAYGACRLDFPLTRLCHVWWRLPLYSIRPPALLDLMVGSDCDASARSVQRWISEMA